VKHSTQKHTTLHTFIQKLRQKTKRTFTRSQHACSLSEHN